MHAAWQDSDAHREWRVLLSYLEELREKQQGSAAGRLGSDLERVAGGDLRPLEFNAAGHVLLAEELKHLYTAITRAKNNVVIFDRRCAAAASLGIRRFIVLLALYTAGNFAS